MRIAGRIQNERDRIPWGLLSAIALLGLVLLLVAFLMPTGVPTDIWLKGHRAAIICLAALPTLFFCAAVLTNPETATTARWWYPRRLLSTWMALRHLEYSPVVFFLFMYLAALWHLPLSEDTGYYGYLARSISEGIVLHNQLPATTNSIALYVLAGLFRLFGVKLLVLRLFVFAGTAALCILCQRIMQMFLSKMLSASLSLVLAVMIVEPRLTLDMGRHFIHWALFLMLLGLVVAYKRPVRAPYNGLVSGFLIGLSSLTRETFLIVAIGVLIYFVTESALAARRNRHAASAPLSVRELSGVAIGLGFGLLPNAILLSAFGSWKAYLNDMLGSGVSFRFGGNYVDLLVQRLSFGTELGSSIFGSTLCLAACGCFFRGSERVLGAIKWALLPLFLIEALAVNKTYSYHFLPIICCGVIIGAGAVSTVKEAIANRETLTVRRFILWGATFASLVFVSRQTYLAASDIRVYYKSQRDIIEKPVDAINEHTERLLSRIESFPHTTLGAYSQFPLLLLASRYYGSPSLVEDMSAPANFSRPKLAEDQIETIEKTPPDVLVLKSLGGRVSVNKNDRLGKAIASGYVVVSDFGQSDGWTAPYFDRILVSAKHLASIFPRREDFRGSALESVGPHRFRGMNRSNTTIVVELDLTQFSGDRSACSIQNGSSTVSITAEPETERLVSLVLPGSYYFVTVPPDGDDFKLSVLSTSETALEPGLSPHM